MSALRYDGQASPNNQLFLTETGNRPQEPGLACTSIKSFVSPAYVRISFSSFLCIGEATLAARCEISDETIRILERRSSQAYLTYVCNNLEDLRQVRTKLSSSQLMGSSQVMSSLFI